MQNKNLILFRKINLITLFLVIYYYWFSRKSQIIYIEVSKIGLLFLKAFLKDERIHTVHPLGHIQHPCYGKALDCVESIYNTLAEKKNFDRLTTHLISHYDYILVYKKELAYELSYVYYIYDLVNKHKEKYKSIIIIDAGFYLYHSLVPEIDESNKYIPGKLVRFFEKFSQAISVKRIQTKVFIVTFYVLVRLFINSNVKTKKKTYQYAVVIRNSRHQFRAKGRYFDFILDHDKITKDKVLFLEQDKIPSELKSKLQHSRYNFSGNLSYKELIKHANRKFLLELLRVFAGFAVSTISLPPLVFIAKSRLIVLLNFLRWKIVLERFHFKNFITYNDEQSGHIARNLIFNAAGIKTWYYAHSASMSYASKNINSIEDKRHILWSYIYYDNYITWNKAMSDYINSHPVYFDNTYIIGCLWSQFIQNEDNTKREKLIVAFDTSYIDNIECGISFYKDIMDYGVNNQRVKIIFKPKKDLRDYIPGKNFWSTPKYKELEKIYSQIKEHDNLSIHEFNADAYSLISEADLIVTHAISSPTFEALCARKRAVFYDPDKKYTDTFYDRIPRLILKTRKELWERFDELLKITDKQYDSFLENYCKGIVEDYLDCNAIGRFRELLCSE